MKNIRYINVTLLLILIAIIAGVTVLNSCKTPEKIASKSGAQLWAENCQRCHNTPSPSSFSHDQWVTVGMHMQSRALITDAEKNKIVAFLQQ